MLGSGESGKNGLLMQIECVNEQRRCKPDDMTILTSKEKSFLDVFLHEATTPSFSGSATEALHKLGIEYGDILYLARA